MTEKRFPYEHSIWSSNEPETQRGWCEALERTGVENVPARLAQTDAGAPGIISIGTELSITIGIRAGMACVA
jgi:hypothetical protein